MGKVLNQFIDKISPTQEAEKSLTLGKVLTDFVEISDKALTKQEEENALKKAQLGQVLNNFKRKTGNLYSNIPLYNTYTFVLIYTYVNILNFFIYRESGISDSIQYPIILSIQSRYPYSST